MVESNRQAYQDLIARIVKRDEAAYRQLFYQFYKDLVHYGYMITQDKGRAEDVVSDLFLKIWTMEERCRKGNPHLIDLYTKYKSKGFEIIGVASDDRSQAAWHKAVDQDKIGIWRHILSGLKFENGEFDRSKSISDHFGISTLPTKILIDPDGMIIGRYASGSETDTELDKKLAEVFGAQ